jgi:branched-chain amino acid transport system permease protein
MILDKRIPTIIIVLLLALAPLVINASGEHFYLDAVRRVMIIAIAAISLQLLVGITGLTSFGHAVYIGIGSYSVGIAAKYGIDSGLIHLTIALVAGTLFSFLIGVVCIRVKGTYFIMVTLAFAQLLYFLGVSLKTFGGDDGMLLKARSLFPGINLSNETIFYYFVFAWLLLTLVFAQRLVESKFGRVLNGIRQNELRMRALGFATLHYKLAIFIIAAILCSLSGVLLANHAEYITPDSMHWSRSGDLLVIVVLGGIGSITGAIIGSALFILLEILLSGYSKHWHLVFGPLLVLFAVFTGPGAARPFARKVRHSL